MGKIMKFCAQCEEGFAEKFGFCPNCGGALAAYEMNPVTGQTNAAENSPVADPPAFESAVEPEANVYSAAAPPISNAEIVSTENAFVAEPAGDSEPEVVEIAPGGNTRAAATAATGYPASQTKLQPNQDDGLYHMTFVEEKDKGVKNALFMGAFALVMTLAVGGVIYNLFAQNALVGALTDDEMLNAYVTAVEPEEIEPEPPKPKEKDDAGGGGGGGNKDPNPVSKGRLADQEKEPQIPPSVTMDRVTNPELVLKPATQGEKKFPPSTEPYGNPNSKFTVASDGGGQGGGQGEGRGRGQGNGQGTGAGNGIGSGYGNGVGTGIGDGTGGGRRGTGDDGDPPPKIKPVGPTEGVKILAKPRANYTDAARQNQVTGVVRVRVTFLASGQIGGITAVSSLPHGLTEQALSAARGLRFEPAKKNGQAVTVTKVVEYNFTLY